MPQQALYKVSLIFFLIVAVIGTLLRSNFVISLPLEFEHLVHAHSHVAFQGWIYTLLFLFLLHFFLSEEQVRKGRYFLQFYLTVTTMIGVLISFSMQGYGLYSIVFSTLFQFLNYWFIFAFLRDSKVISNESVSARLIKVGLFLGLLSTIVPYVIGVLSAKGLKGTEIYDSAVYTFLHLQYNGWFLFVILGLLFRFLSKKSISFNRTAANRFFWLFSISVLPAISLSFLGMSFSTIAAPFAYLSAVLQLISLVFFLQSIYPVLKNTSGLNPWFRVFLLCFIGCFSIKLILQSLSVLPVFETYAFQNKLIIIAYLHLSLIGVISSLLIGFLYQINWLKSGPISLIGNLLLMIGFISTELLLVLGGLGIMHSQLGLAIGSAAMVIGILCLIISPVYRLPESKSIDENHS